MKNSDCIITPGKSETFKLIKEETHIVEYEGGYWMTRDDYWRLKYGEFDTRYAVTGINKSNKRVQVGIDVVYHLSPFSGKFKGQ